MPLKITHPEGTYLKQSRNQASSLSLDQKLFLPNGVTIPCDTIEREQSHYKCTFYVFAEHVSTGNSILVENAPAIPLVATNKPQEFLLRGTIPHFSQRDNYTQSYRTCNSSSCAMGAAFIKPGCIRNDDEYLQRVLSLGDTTDHDVQTRVLKSYGIGSQFRTNLDYEDLDAQLERNRPIVIGILHKGSIHSPSGGHMVIVIGKWEKGYICNDPWGNLNSGYEDHNGEKVYYSRKSLDARWLMDGPKTGWGRIFD